MIRQAHTYLVGALGGVTLIAIAIAIFVALVGAQVFHDWPIADLGSQSPKAAVAPAKALPAAGAAITGGVGATASTARPNPAKAAARTGAVAGKRAHRHAAAVTDATTPALAVESTPSAGDESTGGNSGSQSPQPSSSSPSQGSAPSSGGPGSSSGNSGSGGSGSTATASSGSGSSGATGNSGSGGTVGTVTSTASNATTKPAQVVTEAVNETVNQVDEKVLGGALEKAGVTEATENLVNGVAGPESVVGKTVEGVGEAVGGLLGGGGD